MRRAVALLGLLVVLAGCQHHDGSNSPVEGTWSTRHTTEVYPSPVAVP